MAGDWLKMEANTPEKEEVLSITTIMGWEDPDMTVGKLFRLWRWFDQQTTDGNAGRVTFALLDRIVGVSGFCSAVHDVGWLVATDSGVSLPKFDRHNGLSAKSRAQTAKRVANHKTNGKGNADGNAATVSGALPREEKRREDISTSLRSVEVAEAETTKPARKGTRLADNWQLPKAWGEWAMAEYPAWTAEIVRMEAAKFADHWHAKAGKDGAKLDWEATWRNWCRSPICQEAHAGRPSFAQHSADVARSTVPGKPGKHPALLQIEEDMGRAAPVPENVRKQLERLKGGVLQ